MNKSNKCRKNPAYWGESLHWRTNTSTAYYWECRRTRASFFSIHKHPGPSSRIDLYTVVMSRLQKSKINQNPREASSLSRVFLISLVYVCMYLFVSRLLAKRKTIQTWNSLHILPYTFSKNGFFVFSKKSPWRPLASINCRVTWIFRISPWLPCSPFFFFFEIRVFYFLIWDN